MNVAKTEITPLTGSEIDHVAGGPIWGAFWAGYKAYKLGVTLKAAAFGAGAVAAVEAHNNNEEGR